MGNRILPSGWTETRVKKVLAQYEVQSEEQAVAEDEAALESSAYTLMSVPQPLVPAVRALIAKHRGARGRRRR